MNFAETRFPTDISYGSTGGPEYATDIVVLQSGHEQRNANWQTSRARYNVAHGVKTKGQLETLISFFRARKGRAQAFRFKDWSDYQAVNQLLGIGDGVKTKFSLSKTYSSGGFTEARAITKPVIGTVTVSVNNAVQSSGYSVDATKGEINFDVAPVMGLEVRASFEFDVPVRFETDRLAASLDAYGSHSWNDIPLIEIRLTSEG